MEKRLGQVGQVATLDGSMETWTLWPQFASMSFPDVVSLPRIIGNLFENLTHFLDPLRMQVHSHIMHGHDHTQHGAQRGGIRRSSVEGIAACLLGAPRWKARAWKAKYDKDHAPFGAGIKNTVDHANHLANIELEAPSTLPEIRPIAGAEKYKEEGNSDVDI